MVTQINRMPFNEDNWDSYRARRINPVVAYKLLMLLKAILPINCPAPWLVPINNGGIDAVWLNDDPIHDIDLSISYCSENQILMYTSGLEDDIPFKKDLAIRVIEEIVCMK